ncbi:uncharacterized protein TNCT_597561 [Trichonephila clavata]|uniref:DUF1758 domain-containing protein n=1 Tax=Trichonephila clavata TaxID=2740835 RepID=A0A8X6KXJ3_TRICU|nr:uncharacterized protein TNCT_597561 [Trichonephila clavata]
MNSELAQNKTENLAVASSISNLDRMKSGLQSVFLQTCVVDLQFHNTWIEANLLFDSGSMRSFICKNLAEQLNLPVTQKEHLLIHTFGNREPKEKIFDVVKVIISNKKQPKKSTECELLVSDTITNAVLPTPNLTIEKLLETNHMAQSDLCLSQSNKEINVLIGADLYWQFHTGCIKRINKNLFCVETIFQWTLMGNNNLRKNMDSIVENLCFCEHQSNCNSEIKYCFKTYETNEEFNEYQIVIFCDASGRAYGAIAYIYYKGNSDFHVNFVSSKARVAPLQKLSLQRLELLATLIGARLLKTLRKVFKITNNYILFSYSTVALSWIRGYVKQWKPFASNRVHEIQDLTNPQNWRFVKGEQNPADIVSRGCSAEGLMKNTRFCHGPHWLILSEENWPKNERLSQETTHEERRVKYISINYLSEFQNEEPI